MMNKKGALFATATVLIIFLWLFGNIIMKVHNENELKLKDIGLNTIDLIRQKNNFEMDNYLLKKEIEYKLNDALVRFVKEENFSNDQFSSKFFEFLKRQDEFADYNFELVENNLEFRIEDFKGSGKITDAENCKSEVVESAKSLLNSQCSYELGAKGPCSVGFDCSGLVKWVYVKSDSGVTSFPDGSWIQADWGRRKELVVSNEIGKGAVLEVDKLEPGDIVFFKGSLPTDGYGSAKELDIRHVGVYVGEGKLIEAAGKNTGIVESDIVSKKNYRGAIRVCSSQYEGQEGIFNQDILFVYPIRKEGYIVNSDGLKEI